MSVGTVIVSEGVEVTRYYETASWYSRITLEAGTYPLERDRYGDLRVMIPGVVTEHHFVNRLFTASAVDHRTGLSEPTEYWIGMYAYQVRNATGGVYRPREGVCVMLAEFWESALEEV